MRMGLSMAAVVCLAAGNLVAQVEKTNVDIKAPNGGDLTRAGFDVLAFDLPGFGETRGAFQVDFRNEAEAAYAFLLSQKGADKPGLRALGFGLRASGFGLWALGFGPWDRVAAGGASCSLI